jgi:hypothetical protein
MIYRPNLQQRLNGNKVKCFNIKKSLDCNKSVGAFFGGNGTSSKMWNTENKISILFRYVSII